MQKSGLPEAKWKVRQKVWVSISGYYFKPSTIVAKKYYENRGWVYKVRLPNEIVTEVLEEAIDRGETLRKSIEADEAEIAD